MKLGPVTDRKVNPFRPRALSIPQESQILLLLKLGALDADHAVWRGSRGASLINPTMLGVVLVPAGIVASGKAPILDRPGSGSVTVFWLSKEGYTIALQLAAAAFDRRMEGAS